MAIFFLITRQTFAKKTFSEPVYPRSLELAKTMQCEGDEDIRIASLASWAFSGSASRTVCNR